MNFPIYRPRRMRQNKNLRRLIRETHIAPDQLIMPYFIDETISAKEPIRAMPGQFRFSIDSFLTELDSLRRTGIYHILLFGIPRQKDTKATQAYYSKGIIQQTIRSVKKRFPDLTVITDVCLCEYMSHGHCGILKGNRVANDESLPLLAQTAVSHADAGADLVAPSDMMDGRIGAIRRALDQKGFIHIPIMSYAAKYASAFYGPFRDAAHSAPESGDRKGYQMDPANREEALREIQLDIDEGADIVMVKPAMAYLDVVREAKTKFSIPLAAYQVSGEYVMLKTASAGGYLNERAVVLESLIAIHRAGAQVILTYYAKEAAGWLR